ncbi:hypothetical protein H0H93_010240 [Arthromyces matolae]|nr:hypothetical protein H0H93_010240 [Arthromyces matolae]
MTTWPPTGSISHPWFKLPQSKRKFSQKGDDDEVNPSNSSRSRSPPSKRQRQTALEAGFSSLTLSTRETIASDGQCNVSDLDATNVSPMEDDTSPPKLEEPDIPEVKMKTLSSYEVAPDRIVVTALESSDEEEDGEPEKLISIPTALLKKMMSNAARELVMPVKNATQELVVYQPLLVSDLAPREPDTDEKVPFDDAMDVEP